MSGGSYNYLCDAWDNFLDHLLSHRGHLEEMSKRLAGLGYADDAARETEELLVLLRQWENRAEVRVERLKKVWEAVEWWDSGDRGEDGVREALTAYRGDGPQGRVFQVQGVVSVDERALLEIVRRHGRKPRGDG